MLDAARDLVLGGACVGCGRAGRAWCASCAAALDPRPAPAWPTPPPPGLTQPWAATTYDGAVRAMIVGHKERRQLALAVPLGELLAEAVRSALEALAPSVAGDGGPPVPLALVPVPSRPATTRQRGYQPTAALVRAAAGRLSRTGRPAACVPLLRTRPGVADQSGLDAQARVANLAGAFRVHGPALRRQARAGVAVHVLVCDDVVTTGASLAEAQRALRAVGLVPLAAVAVAATRRRPALRESDFEIPVPRSPATG